jgi:lipoyl(octanoyl) transferase
VITVGRNATDDAIQTDPRLLEARGITLVTTDRGGDATYHGPGQLVGYPILHLEPERRDIRRYVNDLEEVLIRTLADFDINAGRHQEHRGVWTHGRKIASLGIRIARWVTSHGFALNVNTDLSFFSTMHPCGIKGCEMTSLQNELGRIAVDMDEVKKRVQSHFGNVFDRCVQVDTEASARADANERHSHAS